MSDSDIDPALFKKLASIIKDDRLEELAHKAVSQAYGRKHERHRAWKIGYYTLLILTAASMTLALALSITAGFQLHPVNMEVMRWSWGAFAGSGAATSLHRFLDH